MQERFFMIIGSDLNRIHIDEDDIGRMIITVDLHRMNREAAMRILNLILWEYRIPFILNVIHGYNHGTVLKKMVYEEFKSPRVKRKYYSRYNPGEVFMEIG